MKTLLVLRHAKSSWKDSALADHDRPLNRRGREEAPRLGPHLRAKGLVPQVIVSSTARRARDTALAVAKGCGVPTEDVVLEPRLYMSDLELEVIRALPDGAASAMIVGHNPALEELVSELTGEDVEMKTAALAVISFDVGRWRDVSANGRGRLLATTRAKEI